jgi:hypothetical protein
MNAQTGLGRANGTAVADDDWWEEHTKVLRLVCLKSSWTVHFILYTQWLMRTDFLQGNSELKKLRNGPPEWLDQLEVMFEQLVVDGTTSCIPGEQMGDENEEGGEHDQNEGHSSDNGTPRTNYQSKRGNSTCTTATSPQKKSKSPMVRIMKGMLETMQTNYAIAQKVMQGELRTESIKKAMRLAVECGAEEGSFEHFVASQLFVKAELRDVFLTIETKEGRLAWLKWWCQKKKMQ